MGGAPPALMSAHHEADSWDTAPESTMSIEVRRLVDRDDAKRLGDLVYSAYGLTYHRSFIYEPDRVVELNRSGALTSFLAKDATGHVVGHLATLRPWFEIADPVPPGRGPQVLEVGLSIVDPSRRGEQIQGTLALSAVLETAAANTDLRGFYMKCLTSHPMSQKSARRFMGRATALFPAGIPTWVRNDADERDDQGPLTTILLHCPYGTHDERTVHFPVEHVEFARGVYASLGLPRRVRPSRRGALPRGESRVATWFDPVRRHGVAWVRRAGGDLTEAVLNRVEWLLGGHIEHVTVLLPLESAGVAACVPALEDRGLFFGGFIPDLEGCDTLVLERVEATEFRAEDVHVVGEDAVLVRDRVLASWRKSLTNGAIRPCVREIGDAGALSA